MRVGVEAHLLPKKKNMIFSLPRLDWWLLSTTDLLKITWREKMPS